MDDIFFRRVLAGASLLWAAVLVIAVAAHGPGQVGRAASLLSVATYAVSSFVCHQRPERSFLVWGAQFPVCARCAGLYAGAALASIVALTTRYRADLDRISQHARQVLAAAAVPTAATLVYEWTTGDVPSNGIRFGAGLALGAAVMWLVVLVSTSRRAVAIH